MLYQTKTEIPCQSKHGLAYYGCQIRSKLTNFSYNLKNNSYINLPLLSRHQINIQNNNECAFLLGSSYSFSERLQFYTKFRNTIWISYDDTTGDVGWSCTIRSFQMMFAQILRRYFKNYSSKQIIDFFKNQKHGILSLENICKQGHIQQRWISFPEMLAIIGSILKEQRQKNIINFNYNSYSYQIDIKNTIEQSQFPKLITIYCKVVQNDKILPIKYIPHLKQLLKHKTFTGMINGVSTQALYILGSYNDDAIYLDPHYVQNQQHCSEQKQKYFQKIPRGINFNKLSSFFVLSYYFNQKNQFQSWVNYIIKLNNIYQDQCVFKLNVDEKKWLLPDSQESQQYQILDFDF